MTDLNQPIFERSKLIFSHAQLDRLLNAKVLVAGIGGVGGFVAEALARAGIGEIVLIDHDQVSASNLNRQLVALHSTLGLPKVEVMRQRILDIHPLIKVDARAKFLSPEDMRGLIDEGFDAVVDAIDSLNCKVALVEAALRARIPVFSSMGAGRRFDPTKIEVADLMDTHGCGLARQMRQRLRKRGVGRGVKVVFSTEAPCPPGPYEAIEQARGRVVNGTVSYMPGLFGLMLAGEVIKHLTASTDGE